MVSISFVDFCCLLRQSQFFPIWTLTTSSPSVTGFYRMKQTFRCTLSKILDLRYCTCIFNILLSLSQYEIMSVLTLHLTFCAAVFTYSIYTLKLKKNHRRLKYSLDTTNTYITFIFTEKKKCTFGHIKSNFMEFVLPAVAWRFQRFMQKHRKWTARLPLACESIRFSFALRGWETSPAA